MTATDPATEPHLVVRGRCRSGRRWFWFAAELGDGHRCDDPVCIYGGQHDYGWEDTEQAALTAMCTAVARLRGELVLADWHGRPLPQGVGATSAAGALKRINAARRAARPPATASDAELTEYLYAVHWPYDDPGPPYIASFRITRKTARRIWFVQRDYDGTSTGYVDREALERDGEIWHRPSRELLYVTRQQAQMVVGAHTGKPAAAADIRRLRIEMANAHPDRGGTAEEFMAARRRYKQALRRVS